MIPVLYKATETKFNNNGVGLLVDSISCNVTEEKNGVYELELQYPIDGQYFSKIEDGCIIKAKPNENSEPQLFSIYNHSKPIGGICTFRGEHISYKLNGLPVKRFNAAGVTPLSAMNTMLNSAAEITEHNFKAWSDIAEVGATGTEVPCSVRACLGGNENSFLNVWGGEFEFDNFLIKLHASRGKKTDVVIEYGKNLTDAKQERNIAAVYTGVLPYARYTPESDEEGSEEPEEIIVTLPENIIYCENPNRYGMPRVEPKDFTDEFEDDEQINVENLRRKAVNYVNSGIDTPSVNITASFVQLWQTTDYKDIAPLERVSLCDTVTVRFIKLGIDAEAQIIKTVFDSIQERYISVEIGDAKSNFSDTVNNTKAEIEAVKEAAKKESSAAQKRLEQAIKNATELITGHKGGYVVFNPSERPQEILIMDTPDIKTAKSVWRWNSAGLGYSSTGYAGEYATAITMDGAIVADFITAGTLNGSLIQAGTVSAEAISQAFKKALSDEIDGDIETATLAIEQAFTAADGVLSSKITTLEKGLETANTEIQQNKDAITLKAAQYDVDALGTRLSTAEAQITTNANNISLKASQTEVDSIWDEVSYNYSLIEVNADNISSRVRKTMSYEAATRRAGTPTNSNTTTAEKKRLYFNTTTETYYYYDELNSKWIETEEQSIYSAFVQTADGFEFSGLVKINGDLITSGTIKGLTVGTNENIYGDGVRMNTDTQRLEILFNGVVVGCWGYTTLPGGSAIYPAGGGTLTISGVDASGTWDFSGCDEVIGLPSTTAVFG